jgi:hypothetical protein
MMPFQGFSLPKLLIQLIAVSVLIGLYLAHPALGWSVLGVSWISALVMASRGRAERLEATHL